MTEFIHEDFNFDFKIKVNKVTYFIGSISWHDEFHIPFQMCNIYPFIY